MALKINTSSQQRRIQATEEQKDGEIDRLLDKSIDATPPSPLVSIGGGMRRVASKSILKRESSYADLSIASSMHSINSSISQSTRGMKKSGSVVSFNSVAVREYEVTLGDNPSCMSGPPISLDWTYSAESEICMEEYEKTKTKKSSGRRRKKGVPVRMSKFDRLNMLKNNLGYSDEEIKAATQEKRLAQRCRSMTNLTSQLWRVEDVIESTKRKLGRKLSSKDSKPSMPNLREPDLLDSSNSSTRSKPSFLGSSRSKQSMPNLRKAGGFLGSGSTSKPSMPNLRESGTFLDTSINKPSMSSMTKSRSFLDSSMPVSSSTNSTGSFSSNDDEDEPLEF